LALSRTRRVEGRVPGVGRQAWLLLKVVGLGSESQLHLQRNQSHSCCCWICCHHPSFLLLILPNPISATFDTLWQSPSLLPPLPLSFSFLTHSFTFRQSLSLTLKLERQETFMAGLTKGRKPPGLPTHGSHVHSDICKEVHISMQSRAYLYAQMTHGRRRRCVYD